MIATVRATVFGDSSASTAQHSPAHATGAPAGAPVRPVHLGVWQVLPDADPVP